ncbi:hypothetical protein [Burkholderia multivorans]|uniref:hypothetical protein n=1 Tax=Burkholderia multivorans TaxID=87883 RepID=UPI001EE63BBF|nr:hypothetical protein [Burkholderia multivorans]
MPQTDENRFPQYCILNLEMIGAERKRYCDQRVKVGEGAGRSAARARRALRDGDTRPVAARSRYSAIIDTSAIEVCAGHG